MKTSTFADYADAALPDTWRVFGVRLQPFCLGHAILLAKARNAFWSGGKITLGQLLYALFVCSRSSADARRDVSRGLPWRWWSFIARVRLALALRPELLISRAAIVNEYIRAALDAGPALWSESEGEPEDVPVAPDLVNLYVELRGDGYAESEVLDMPLGQALWIIAAKRAQEGRVRFVSSGDAELAAHAERLRAEANA